MKKVVSQVAANNWGILFLMTDGTLKWVKHESPIWGYNDGISSRPDVSDVILPGVTQVAANSEGAR